MTDTTLHELHRTCRHSPRNRSVASDSKPSVNDSNADGCTAPTSTKTPGTPTPAPVEFTSSSSRACIADARADAALASASGCDAAAVPQRASSVNSDNSCNGSAADSR
jgi:hypothetical protein